MGGLQIEGIQDQSDDIIGNRGFDGVGAVLAAVLPAEALQGSLSVSSPLQTHTSPSKEINSIPEPERQAQLPIMPCTAFQET